MSNIAISDLQSTASSLENDDLLLVSKKNGGTYTSMKMPGSVLKNSGTECLFTEDKVKNALTSYGAAKTSDVTSAKTAIQTSISGLNNLSSSQVQSACESAISSASVSGLFIESDGIKGTTSNEVTLTSNSLIVIGTHDDSSVTSNSWCSIRIGDDYESDYDITTKLVSGGIYTAPLSFYVKKGVKISFLCGGSGYYKILPVS